MADKRILKVTAAQAAFVITGTGNATISIYDALHSSQTIDAGNVQLTLTDIAYDVGNLANIKRSGNIVFACNAEVPPKIEAFADCNVEMSFAASLYAWRNSLNVFANCTWDAICFLSLY